MVYKVAFGRALDKKSIKQLCNKVNQFILVEGYFIKPSPLNNFVGCCFWRIHLDFLGSRLQLILYSFQLCTYDRSFWVFPQFTILTAYERHPIEVIHMDNTPILIVTLVSNLYCYQSESLKHLSVPWLRLCSCL